MKAAKISRRSFLNYCGSAGAGLALGGCDILDEARNTDHAFRKFMASANGLTFRAQRMLLGPDSLAREYDASDIRQPQRPNGVTDPQDADYRQLVDQSFQNYVLEIGGLVQRPLSIKYADLIAMPSRTQITRHDCVEGWSCIAEWTGVQLSKILAEVQPKPNAKFVLFDCFDTIERSLSGAVKYYETIDMIDALHPQTILAHRVNGEALPIANGAPLRLRVERQLGYKHAKYIRSIKLVSGFANIGGGKGGYWEDRGYEWYAGI